MKKLFLIALFFTSFLSKAEFISATLHYNDGTKKTGFAELVGIEDKTVKFRTELKGKTEKIPSADLSKIEFTDKNDNKYVSVRTKIWSIGFLKYKYFEEKAWLYQIHEKQGYRLLSSVSATKFSTGAKNSYTDPGETFFYYGKVSDDVVYLGFTQSNAGLAIHTVRAKQIKLMVEEMFKGKCKLDDKIEKIEFDRKSGEDPFKVLDILIKGKCK